MARTCTDDTGPLIVTCSSNSPDRNSCLCHFPVRRPTYSRTGDGTSLTYSPTFTGLMTVYSNIGNTLARVHGLDWRFQAQLTVVTDKLLTRRVVSVLPRMAGWRNRRNSIYDG